MIELIFTVYDNAAGAYLAPFTAKTAGLAVRMFEELCATEGHQFNKFPGDYTLFQVGIWDLENGVPTATEKTDLGTAIQYVANQNEPLRMIEA